MQIIMVARPGQKLGTLRLATTDYRWLDGRLLGLGRDKGLSPKPPSSLGRLGRYRGPWTVRSRADSRSRESADNTDNAVR